MLVCNRCKIPITGVDMNKGFEGKFFEVEQLINGERIEFCSDCTEEFKMILGQFITSDRLNTKE